MKMKLKVLVVIVGWLSFVSGTSPKRKISERRTRRLSTYRGYDLRDDADSRDGALPRQVYGEEQRKHSYSRSCKSPGKGGSTCFPSSSPSSAPSISSPPSQVPSVSPTDRPSTAPSNGPSTSPSVSNAPSSVPSLSTMPSAKPTDLPSSSPSSRPSSSPSWAPSQVPSSRPSMSSLPSQMPTNRPSESPTISIAPSVLPSNVPSVSPTFLPSETPSLSIGPSINPTDLPSNVPSLSVAPTVKLFETDDGSDAGLVSTCIQTLPAGTTQEQTLAFRYNMFLVPSADSADSVNTMEAALHNGLAQNFLTCDFDNVDASFHIVAIDSQPMDAVGSDACDTSGAPVPAEPFVCVVVEAALSMTALFTNIRRLQTTDATPEVQDATAEYLEGSMENGDFEDSDILQVVFLGFVNVQTSDTTGGAGDGVVVGAIAGGPVQPDNEESNLAAGSFIVGLAAFCLIVAAVVSMRYRKNRRDEYMRHLDELSMMSEDKQVDRTLTLESDGGGGGDIGGEVEIVGEGDHKKDFNEIDSLEETFQIFEAEEIAHADVHQCSSATCDICQYREIRPTFIPVKFNISDMRKDFSSPDRPRTLEMPRTPDTVEL